MAQDKIYTLGRGLPSASRLKINQIANNTEIRDYVADLLQAGATMAEAAVAVNRKFDASISKTDVHYLVQALGGKEVVKQDIQITIRRPQLLVDMSKHKTDGTAESQISKLQQDAEERGALLHELFMYTAKKCNGFVEEDEPIPPSLLQSVTNLARTANATSEMLVKQFYTVEETHTASKSTERFRQPPGLLRHENGKTIIELLPEPEDATAEESDGTDEEETRDEAPAQTKSEISSAAKGAAWALAELENY